MPTGMANLRQGIVFRQYGDPWTRGIAHFGTKSGFESAKGLFHRQIRCRQMVGQVLTGIKLLITQFGAGVNLQCDLAHQGQMLFEGRAHAIMEGSWHDRTPGKSWRERIKVDL